jgi:hypothetical protein
MNSWLGNHDIMGMLPIPQKAVEQGLAPPQTYSHTSQEKNPGAQQWGFTPEADFILPKPPKLQP